VQYNGSLLVDGGLTNPFPLNRVKRTRGDILVGVNISANDTMEAGLNIDLRNRPEKWGKLGQNKKVQKLWDKFATNIEESNFMPQVNYLSLVNRTIDVQIQANCQMMAEFYKPDVLVEMPQNAYTTFDFDKAAEVIEKGRELMSAALDKYENQN